MQVLAPPLSHTIIPHDLMEVYRDIQKRKTKHNWKNISEEKLWHELVFCILSANVSYELVNSTMSYLIKNHFLDYEWLISNEKSANIIHHKMSESNFLPRKKDGELRKYRYPKRSLYIVESAKRIYSKNNSLKQILSHSTSDFELRNELTSLILGIGLKESSHFLRNVGFSNKLAIIDIHVFDFCREFLQLSLPSKSVNSSKQYFHLEEILQNFSLYHRLNLDTFDLAIWYYMRQKYQ